MSFRGSKIIAFGQASVLIDAPVQNVNLWEELGSPSGPLFIYVLVDAEVSSASALLPAMTDQGLHPDSEILMDITASGSILGAGGNGGTGGRIQRSFFVDEGVMYPSGGGGGAGTSPGAGGGIHPGAMPPTAVGSPGTALLGGGVVTGTPFFEFILHPQVNNTFPEDGGDALSVGVPYTITNNGNIWAGGGGGCSGSAMPTDPSEGGDLAQPGVEGPHPLNDQFNPATYQSKAGFAVRLRAGAPAPLFTVGGTFPDLQGDIGV